MSALTCDMHMGDEEATAWGCDLTYDYVKINGDYRHLMVDQKEANNDAMNALTTIWNGRKS